MIQTPGMAAHVTRERTPGLCEFLGLPSRKKRNTMNLSSFFLSVPGAYMAQSFCHALVSVTIVERAIHTWQIQDPLMRQRFRFIVIVFPVFSWPVYQLLNPERGSIHFRFEALFDFNRWLDLDLGGVVQIHLLFLLVLILSTLIFIFQEMIPILKHTREVKSREIQTHRPDANSMVSQVLREIRGERPEVFLVEDDDYILFSATGKKAAVFLSTGLVRALDRDQLQVALVHEMAHILRNKRPSLLIMFLLRVMMFFNPVILIEFRKIVQEEEKICDDIAVSVTKKPHALAEALKKLFHTAEGSKTFRVEKLGDVKSRLEEYSQSMLIDGRIRRLEQGSAGVKDSAWFKWSLTLIIISVINYYVV